MEKRACMQYTASLFWPMMHDEVAVTDDSWLMTHHHLCESHFDEKCETRVI
jgi:hypothetical protein